MFHQINLSSIDHIIYDKLVNEINWEFITNGRVGANLYLKSSFENETFPLVRTTTSYSKPMSKFNTVHLELINKIKTQAKTQLDLDLGELNNGLAEIYFPEYKTMGLHSDQSLDLLNSSWICIYTHYSNPLSKSLRNLEITNKIDGKKTSIQLQHNSVVMFDLATNQSNLHKIILNQTKNSNKNNSANTNWFGLTLRTSKTKIKFDTKSPTETIPLIFNPTSNKYIELKLAISEEKKEFYKLRSKENALTKFEYPFIEYTISPSDLIKPN